MRLYSVAYACSCDPQAGFYWAENENDAIHQHRMQTGTGLKLVASSVWANNADKTLRGYVVKENND